MRGTGSFSVRRGQGMLARLLVRLMRLPAAGEAVPVRLVLTYHRAGERWERTFAGKPFITEQHAGVGQHMVERIGLVEVWYRLRAADHALSYVQTRAGIRLGPLLIPLPRLLSPHIAAREWAQPAEPGVHVSVSVTWALAGLLIAYEGYIEMERS